MTGLRSRDLAGKLRQKRGDALVGTIEQHYGVDFHCRSDMGTRLERRLKRRNGEAEVATHVVTEDRGGDTRPDEITAGVRMGRL